MVSSHMLRYLFATCLVTLTKPMDLNVDRLAIEAFDLMHQGNNSIGLRVLQAALRLEGDQRGNDSRRRVAETGPVHFSSTKVIRSGTPESRFCFRPPSRSMWSVNMCFSILEGAEPLSFAELSVHRLEGCQLGAHGQAINNSLQGQHFVHAELEGPELVSLHTVRVSACAFTVGTEHGIRVPGFYTLSMLCYGECTGGSQILESPIELKIAFPSDDQTTAEKIEAIHHPAIHPRWCGAGDLSAQDGRWVASSTTALFPRACDRHAIACHAQDVLRYSSMRRDLELARTWKVDPWRFVWVPTSGCRHRPIDHVAGCLGGKRVLFTGTLATTRPLFQALLEQVCRVRVFENKGSEDAVWCYAGAELAGSACDGATVCLVRSALPVSRAVLHGGRWDMVIASFLGSSLPHFQRRLEALVESVGPLLEGHTGEGGMGDGARLVWVSPLAAATSQELQRGWDGWSLNQRSAACDELVRSRWAELGARPMYAGRLYLVDALSLTLPLADAVQSFNQRYWLLHLRPAVQQIAGVACPRGAQEERQAQVDRQEDAVGAGGEAASARARERLERWASAACQEHHRGECRQRDYAQGECDMAGLRQWAGSSFALKTTCVAEDVNGAMGRNQTSKLANEVMVCERYKAVYVVNRKAACTTLRYILQRYLGCSSADHACVWEHDPLCLVLDGRCSSICLSQHHVTDFLFFSFVRDPVDRFWSSVAQLVRSKRGLKPTTDNLLEYLQSMVSSHTEGSTFVRNHLLESQALALSSPAGIAKGCMVPMHFIGHLDSFEDDLLHLLGLIERYSGHPVPRIPRAEMGARNVGGSSKAAVMDGMRTPDMDALVREAYAQDLACFGK